MLTIHVHPVHVHEIRESEDHDVDPRSGKRIDEGAAPRPPRGGPPVCAQCLDRPALTLIRGRHVVSKHHDLCRQCFESQRDSGKATRLARRVRLARRRGGAR